MNTVKDVADFISDRQRFAIVSHARPDGDSIGSSLGLALSLQELGKTAHVFSCDQPPRAYGSLPGADTIRVTERVTGDYEALVVLECNDLERPDLKGLDEYFVINIDHHPKTKPFGDLNWMDPEAAAVGEMIYQMAKALGIGITPQIAANLYVAILTDTGSFQYSNTRADTFLIVNDLMRCGADPSAIAQLVYMTQPYSRIKLLGRLLNTLELHPSQQIATISLSREMLQATGASADDTEGIVNYPLSIRGVVLAAFFREESGDRQRISLRSKNQLDVRSVAERFGGGGHVNAAGLAIQGNLEEAKASVLSELEKLLEKETTS